MPIVGDAPCLACGREIPIKENDKGTHSWCCTWCDFSAYAKKGTEALTRLLKRMKPRAAPAPSSDPSPEARGESSAPEKQAAPRMPWMSR